MDILKLASFTRDGTGGNPAGVVIGDAHPEQAVMQEIAAQVGFSETAFAAPTDNGFRVRYFAPQAEVPFCGHATIALGAALGAAYGTGQYNLALNEAEISVEAYWQNGEWGAKLISPGTSYAPVDAAVLNSFLSLFNLAQSDLDPDISPATVNGGAQHLLLALGRHKTLQNMSYDFDAGAALMQKHGFVTVNLVHRAPPGLIFSRNAFAGHGVYEDPATGAAAAALAGYLRDAGLQSGPFEVVQGVEMGSASLLHVEALKGRGACVAVSGATRVMI
ncbi:MAG: PhzF family phenazine biosynthesis isomerase [Rhodobacteraceae bacterium]|nr:PhzF family phenazine biosynthesis isomerase [Paracoccaceae bacterium]